MVVFSLSDIFDIANIKMKICAVKTFLVEGMKYNWTLLKIVTDAVPYLSRLHVVLRNDETER